MEEQTHVHTEHEHNHDHAEHAHPAKKDLKLTTPGAIVLNGFIIALSIIIAALMMGGHFGSGDARTPGTPNTVADDSQKAQPIAPDIKNVVINGEPFVGNPVATATLAYWSDFQCPYCKKFETTTFQTILKNYVQSGKVKIVFKDFTFLGDDSTTASLYSRAVWDLYPDKYFAWREAMYNAQDGENTGFGDETSVVKLTATVPGIDATKVKKQVSLKKDIYQKMLDTDREEGANFGIQGTPSFITGTKLIAGNSPLADFSKALDPQLK